VAPLASERTSVRPPQFGQKSAALPKSVLHVGQYLLDIVITSLAFHFQFQDFAGAKDNGQHRFLTSSVPNLLRVIERMSDI
jgi:hypothetical protein